MQIKQSHNLQISKIRQSFTTLNKLVLIEYSDSLADINT